MGRPKMSTEEKRKHKQEYMKTYQRNRYTYDDKYRTNRRKLSLDYYHCHNKI